MTVQDDSILDLTIGGNPVLVSDTNPKTLEKTNSTSLNKSSIMREKTPYLTPIVQDGKELLVIKKQNIPKNKTKRIMTNKKMKMKVTLPSHVGTLDLLRVRIVMKCILHDEELYGVHKRDHEGRIVLGTFKKYIKHHQAHEIFMDII